MEGFRVPEGPELRRWLRERKRAMDRQRIKGGVEPSLVVGLGFTWEALHKRKRYEEALNVIDVALEGVRHVEDHDARVNLSYTAWRSKAFTSSWAGRWGESVRAYRKTISFGDKGPYDEDKLLDGPGDVRALGTMHFRMGNYADCLALLAEAEERLERVRSRLSSRAHGDELARIRAAYALVHMDLGQYERAEASAAEAAEIQEGLAKMGELGTRRLDRVLQASINYTHLGNAQREKARVLGQASRARTRRTPTPCACSRTTVCGRPRGREATRSSLRRQGTGSRMLTCNED